VARGDPGTEYLGPAFGGSDVSPKRIILDAAIAQIAAERLRGQLLLLLDTAIKLAEQLQMATDLSTRFNELAVEVGRRRDRS
jgi:hypothetical protein